MLEIGFAQKYEDLLKRMKMWTSKESMKPVFFFVYIDEAPRYRCPIKDIDLEALPRAAQVDENMLDLQSPSGPFGPRTMLGYTWVGRTSAFLELWGRDSVIQEQQQREACMVSMVIPFGLLANVSGKTFIGGKEDPPKGCDDLVVWRFQDGIAEKSKRLEGKNDPGHVARRCC